ncbi:MAG: hypothetical protein COT00_00720 [Candidatus Omnitrophica bacterium CG07_land_8_20_14_0_80_50_8]|nr:MAG: hypothetical protein COT00_00720 [Candidatus Omnitrophica bacterium CG07_land_8_20_14_0_80_50_8]
MATGGTLSFTAGTLDLNGRTLTLGNDFTPVPTSTAVLDLSTNGGGTLSGALYNFTLNNANMTITQGAGTITVQDYSHSTGTHTFSGTINSRDFSHTGGTLTASGTSSINASGDVVITSAWTNTGNTLTMSGAAKSINASQALRDLIITGSISINAANNLVLNGNFDLQAGSFSQNSKNMNAAGDFTLAVGTTFTKGGTLTFDGTQVQNYNDHTAGIQNLGTLIVTGASTNLNMQTDLTCDSLALQASGVVTTNNYTLTIGTGGLNINLGTTLDATGTAAIDIAGDWTNSGVFTAGFSTVTFTGTNDQSITPGVSSFNNLTINNTGLAGSDDITIVGDLTVDGVFRLTDGNFHAPGAANVFNIGDDFIVTGGTFTHNSGRVTLDTLTEATLDAPAGGLDFWDLTIATAGKTVKFTTGKTFNVLSPSTWVVNGVTLEGAGAGQWSIGLQADGWDIQDSTVSDSNNLNYATVGSLKEGGVFTNVTDGGNNSNWFETATPPPCNDCEPPPCTNCEPPPVCTDCEPIIDPDPDPDPSPTPGSASQPGQPSFVSDPCLDSPFGADGSNPCGGNRIKEDVEEKEDTEERTEVFVTEGAVDVSGNMVYDGESIRIGKDKQAAFKMRSIYISFEDGLQILRGKIHEQLKGIKLKDTASGLAVSKKGGEVYAVLPKFGKISVIDTATREGTKNIFGLSKTSGDVVLSDDESYAYVAIPADDRIQKVSLKSGNIEIVLKTGSYPSRLVLMRDNQTLFVSNTLGGTVSKINTITGREEAVLKVGERPNGLCLSPDETVLYVADSRKGTVVIVSVKTMQITQEIKVGESPYIVKMSPDGKHLFVANRKSNTLSVVELDTQKVSEFKVGEAPGDIAITPEGDKVYVVNQLSGSLSVLNMKNNTIEQISVGSAPSHVVISSPSISKP